MRTVLISALITISACLVAIADQQSSGKPEAATTTLGYLETRDKIITINAGPQPTYTVKTKQGKLLAKDINAKQLQAKFPELHKIVERGLAGGEDARLNLNDTGRISVVPPSR